MSHPKRGLKALGLSLLAALGLMAFMAAGAQAGWLVLLSGTATEITSGEVDANEHTVGTLLVPGLNLEIQCANVEDNDILLGAGATATGKVNFSECLTYSTAGTLTLAKNCTPQNQPIKAGGTAKVILHGGSNYVLFSPTGANFAVIEFGELCSLTETSEVTGNLVAECGHLNGSSVFVALDCANHQITGLLRQASAALFSGDKLQFGEQNATIDGIASVKLAGNHAGFAWGGHV